MSVVKRETLENLISKTSNLNLSIFIPTHIRGEEGKQDHLKFKNMLQRIRRDLEGKGWKENQIDNLFKGSEELINDIDFWLHQNKGLVLYMNEDYFEYFKIPLSPEENYYLSENFLITPLLELQNHHEVYHILAVSQAQTRFYKVTPEEITQINLDDVPTSMEEHLKYHEVEQNMQQHTGTAGRMSGGGGVFHGQGPEFHEDKEIELFLKHIESEVSKILKRGNSPLVLAGLDKMVSHYKKVNHYKNTLDNCIIGSVDAKSPEQLNEEAWKYVEPYFRKEIDDSLERYYDMNGSGSSSTDFSEIVKGAYFSKVDTLFVPIGRQQFGKFDAEANEVHTVQTRTDGTMDLINFSAISALRNGSTIYGLQPEEMPDSANLAAIYRYKT